MANSSESSGHTSVNAQRLNSSGHTPGVLETESEFLMFEENAESKEFGNKILKWMTENEDEELRGFIIVMAGILIAMCLQSVLST